MNRLILKIVAFAVILLIILLISIYWERGTLYEKGSDAVWSEEIEPKPLSSMELLSFEGVVTYRVNAIHVYEEIENYCERLGFVLTSIDTTHGFKNPFVTFQDGISTIVVCYPDKPSSYSPNYEYYTIKKGDLIIKEKGDTLLQIIDSKKDTSYIYQLGLPLNI